MLMPARIETVGLKVAFGPVVAVHSLDLCVAPGSSVALVGRNGAGKSTTLRVLAGVLPPTGGDVRVAGIDVRRDPAGGQGAGRLLPGRRRADPARHPVGAPRARR